ncbi:hypothetical protein D3C85_1740450 [compost metagenome]
MRQFPPATRSTLTGTTSGSACRKSSAEEVMRKPEMVSVFSPASSMVIDLPR